MPEPVQAISDGQFAAIIAALTTFGVGLIGFLKWAFTQWMADRKEDRNERKAERDTLIAARDADRSTVNASLFEIHVTLATMLERDRIRDAERRKRESTPAHRVPEDFRHEQREDTAVIHSRVRANLEKQRNKPTPPVGVRPPRAGTHHDGEG